MKIVLSILSILSYIAAAFMVAMGIDKYANYYNSEDDILSDLSVNAYVGGDAYNYIINGTYMTAFFSLAGAFFVGGTILLAMTVWLHYKNKPLGGI
ncbi:hypothetical protein C0431_12745 [bacterium]|nr:hypothetical protein [bacterium]